MPPNSLFRSLLLYFATNMQHSVQERPFETLWFTEVIFNMYFEISTNYPESTWREMIEWLVERRFLRACPREHRAVVLHAISPISLKLCQFKGSTSKLKKTNRFLFWFFPEGDRPPPVFLGFHQGNRFKIGKMYEALTAMVFNQLLWGFAHIFFHP